MRTRLFYTLIFLAFSAVGQYTSGVEGTIVDQSGAAIPGAQVTVRNEGTRVSSEATTNAAGYFRSPDLPPGAYSVEVRVAGFQNWIQRGIQVDAHQLRTVYPKLVVGQQDAAVEVSAHTETIETGQSALATAIAQRTIEEAPMLGRNIFGGVAFIAPGVTGSGLLFGGGATGNSNQDSFQTQPGFQINSGGQRQENNEYRVDGSSVNGNSRDGISNLTPEPDTVQEIRVAAAAFTAET